MSDADVDLDAARAHLDAALSRLSDLAREAHIADAASVPKSDGFATNAWTEEIWQIAIALSDASAALGYEFWIDR